MDRLLPTRTRAALAIALLGAYAVLDAVVLWLDTVEFSLLYDLMNGLEVPVREIETSDARQSAAAVAGQVLFAATTIAFLTWFHAVYVAVERAGRARPRHSATWAVVAWFVPFLNLVRPKQIADDLWAASGHDAAEGHGHRLLTQWWALWVAATLGEIAVSRAGSGAATAEALQSIALLHAIVVAVHLAAAVWAIRVVRSLTARQARLLGEVRAPAEAAVAAPGA